MEQFGSSRLAKHFVGFLRVICLKTTAVAVFTSLLLQFVLAYSGTAHAATVVGSVAGSLSVERGSAAYSMPLELPPGIAGMKPELGLSYSNRSGNGWLGVGWQLTGLSSITRCTKTWVMDGERKAVGNTISDGYCLDGQRLVLAQGVYGTEGAEYRTAVDGISKIVSHGAQGGGPLSFEVFTKSGQVMRYGQAEDARVLVSDTNNTVSVWALNQISDVVGNTITVSYTYDNAQGIHRPAAVEYADVKVVFSYGDRPDQPFGYSAGRLTAIDKRMAEIVVYVGVDSTTSIGSMTPSRRYKLSYLPLQSATTGRSLLASVQYCANGGGVEACYAPTSFSWSNGAYQKSSGFEVMSSHEPPVQFITDGRVDDGARMADIDGDGRVDIVKVMGQGVRRAYLNKEAGWALDDGFSPPPVDFIYPESKLDTQGRLVDFTGDGLPDAFRGQFDLAESNRKSFINLGDRWGTPKFEYFAPITPYKTGDYGQRFGELNGDGLVDLLFSPWAGKDADRKAFINGGEGTGWVPAPTSFDPPNTFVGIWNDNSQPLPTLRLLDVNGDGMVDIVKSKGTDRKTWLSGKDGWRQSLRYRLPVALGDDSYHDLGVRFADMNGDGLVDVITNVGYAQPLNPDLYDPEQWQSDPSTFYSCIDGEIGHVYPEVSVSPTPECSAGREISWSGSCLTVPSCGSSGTYRASSVANTKTRIYYNTGDGWQQSSKDYRFGGHSQVYARYGDFNGDGVTDVYFTKPTSRFATSNPGGVVYIWKNGDWVVDTSIVISLSSLGKYTNNGLYAADLDGNGVVDFMQSKGGARAAYRNKAEPEFIEKITDGLGSEIHIEYGLGVDPAIYTKGSGAKFPVVEIPMPQYLVKRVGKDDGTGGVSWKAYHYEGARAHAQGHGFLGFAKETVTDENSGAYTVTEYRQDYPYVGMPSKVTSAVLVNGQPRVISEVSSDYGYVDTHSPTGWVTGVHEPCTHGQSCFPHLTQKVEVSKELNGAIISTVTTTHSGYDDHGNVGRVEVVTVSGGESVRKVTDNTYLDAQLNSAFAAKWCLGRLASATVEHSGTGLTPVTRSSAFDYDPTTCLLTEETIEPGEGNPVKQVTSYLYDTHGNKTLVSVRGVAPDSTPRTTTTTYDADGKFPVQVTNALGHLETRQYDPVHGGMTNLTGPNGLTTNWQYDAFGRKVREDRADGTWTTWERGVATGDPDATDLLPHASYYVTEQTSGSAPKTQIHDRLGRAIRKVSVGFDGTHVYQDTVYDRRGRELKSSLPYFKGDRAYWVLNIYDEANRTKRKVAKTDKQTINTYYEFSGLAITEINTQGQRKTTLKNALGKVARVDEEEGAYVRYKYDALGNLTDTWQGDDNTGQEVHTRITYDTRGRKDWMDDPDMGVWDYNYNTFGELVSQTNAKGQTVSMIYDALGRMKTRSEPEGSTEWRYDTAANGIGKLHWVKQKNAAGQTLFYKKLGYDEFGRVKTTTVEVYKPNGTLDQAFTTTTGYDEFSRVATTTRPEGFVVENVYNANGYLQARRSPIGQVGDYDLGQLTSLYDEAVASAQAAIDQAAAYNAQAVAFEQKADQYLQLAGASSPTYDLAPGSPPLDDPRGYPTYTGPGGALYAESRPLQVILHGEIATPITVAPEQHYKLVQDAGGEWTVTTLTPLAWKLAQPLLTATGDRLLLADLDNDGVSEYRQVPESYDTPPLDADTLTRLNQLAGDIRAAAAVLAQQADDAIRLAEQLLVVAANLHDRIRQAGVWADGSGTGSLDAMTGAETGGQMTWWQATERDASGRLVGHRLGNGMFTLRDYQPATGQLQTIQTGFEYGNLIRHLEYEYDGLNNVTARYDDFQGVRETFRYDGLNRLIKSNVDGVVLGVNVDNDTDYGYDALGNITSKTGVGTYQYQAGATAAGPHAVSKIGATE